MVIPAKKVLVGAKIAGIDILKTKSVIL